MGRSSLSMLLMAAALVAAPLPALVGIVGLNAAFAEPVPVVEINKPAPEFTLPGADGKQHSLKEYLGKTVVLEWFNHECPFVKKHYAAPTMNMQKLQKAAVDKGIVWLSINSSAKSRQGYQTAEEAAAGAKSREAASTAILLDHEGTVGHLYGARTTPAMYVIDKSGVLRYMGAIDDIISTDPEDIANAKNYVTQALSELEAGSKISEPVTESYGCSVKYAL